MSTPTAPGPNIQHTFQFIRKDNRQELHHLDANDPVQIAINNRLSFVIEQTHKDYFKFRNVIKNGGQIRVIQFRYNMGTGQWDFCGVLSYSVWKDNKTIRGTKFPDGLGSSIRNVDRVFAAGANVDTDASTNAA